MIIGAWFHPSGVRRVEDSGFSEAAKTGINAVRTYNYEHSEKIAGIIKKLNMSLYAGIYVDSENLLKDWHNEIKQEHILGTHKLSIPLTAICLGNELREYMKGEPPNWKFTGRLAFALSNLITATRKLIQEYGFNTPVTYAMEGFGLDFDGKIKEWVVPIVEAVDIYSVNCYPMEAKDWFTLDAFEHNKRFLTDAREANLRLARFEFMLRSLLNELEKYDKPLIISETGLHAGVGFRAVKTKAKGKTNSIETLDGKKIIPIQDTNNFMRVYLQLSEVISRVNRDYSGRIHGVFIYEWRDNPFHRKIKSENSPVHACFGLCYVDGTPKFDISRVMSILRGEKKNQT
ncbi:MAG: hypothetical protein FGF50_00325 [Candidatus Brockarchaeota archaeon]|nr:hypothetical protein [Candidatus Brockarchaeota archaeon]